MKLDDGDVRRALLIEQGLRHIDARNGTIPRPADLVTKDGDQQLGPLWTDPEPNGDGSFRCNP